MQEKEKATHALLTHASENPNQTLIVSEINGQIRVDCHIKDCGMALLMQHALRLELEKLLYREMTRPTK